MDKQAMSAFFNACTTCGVNEYAFRFNGGNKIAYHNIESARFKLLEDTIVLIETNPNFGQLNCPFIISGLDYDNVDSVYAANLTVKQSEDLLKELGAFDDDMKDFISNRGSRSNLIPASNGYGSTGGISALKDKDGNITIGQQSVGMITK